MNHQHPLGIFLSILVSTPERAEDGERQKLWASPQVVAGEYSGTSPRTVEWQEL
jgi:hypothetical protein